MSSAYCDHLVKEGISMTQKIKNILIIILLFLGITLLFLLTLLSRRVTRVPEDAIGNTAGNLLNGGLFCEDEDVFEFLCHGNAFFHKVIAVRIRKLSLPHSRILL